MTDALGLRERKKIQTRTTLIEAAAELCLRQGFDRTTVDQIAAAADVAPRTFSRYFPNKEAVVAAINDDMDQLVAHALERQPLDISEYEALLRAFTSIFQSPDGRDTPAFRRMAVLIQIVNSAVSFRASALSYQSGTTANAGQRVMAKRMKLAVDDPAVALVADTWTLMFARSFAGLGLPGHPPIEAAIVCERLGTTFDLFRRTWSPWNGPNSNRPTSNASQPPTSAPRG